MKVGEILNDRYELLAELGRGSSGTVLKAKDTLLGSTVCVKILREGLANDEHVVERFKRELLLARRLSHPGICKAFDLQQVDDTTVFLVMEYIDGESLAARLNRDRSPMNPEEAVRIVYGAADAVGVANAQNIVHRDLKPGNILIRDDESIVVVDFGIATAGDMEKLTTPGLVLGSSRYISPERWLGEEAKPPSDVWSLGIILYGCLTARLPFDGEGPFGAFEAMQKGPPDPPKLYNPDVGDRLQAILKTALAYKVEDRYPDAGAFARALEAIVDPNTKSLPRTDAFTESALGTVPAPLDPVPAARTAPGTVGDDTVTADGVLPWPATAASTEPVREERPPQVEPAPPPPVQQAAPVAHPDVPVRPAAPVTAPLEGAPTPDAAVEDTVIGPPPTASEQDPGTTGDEMLTEVDQSHDLIDAGPTLVIRDPHETAALPLPDDGLPDDELSHQLLRGQRNLRIGAALGAALLVVLVTVLAFRGDGGDDAPPATQIAQATPPNPPEAAAAPTNDDNGNKPDDEAPTDDDKANDDVKPNIDDNRADDPDDDNLSDGFDFAEGDEVDAADQPDAPPAAADAHATSDAPRASSAARSTSRSPRRARTSKAKAAKRRRAQAASSATEHEQARGALRDVAAAIKAKGLLPGDDQVVDASYSAIKKASRRKDDAAVVRLAERALAAVNATQIDRKLVDRKLTRFNRKYDAVTDDNKKQKLNRAIANIRAPFQRGDYAAANAALNKAFALF